MSREREVGLNIVCRHHPDKVLFWPRMALDASRKMREAGPQNVMRGVTLDSGALKLSRRCGQPVRQEGGAIVREPGGMVRRCSVNLEYRHEKVRTLLTALAQYVQFKPERRAIWTLTDYEMVQLISRPQHAYAYLSARPTGFDPWLSATM